MRAIVNTGPGKLDLLDWPQPEPGPGEVRVKTAFCGICSTDLKMIGGWQRTGVPSIPGHEWSGVVNAVGEGVDPGLVGRHCVAENVLADGGEVGFEHPGGYGEMLITAASCLFPLPEAVPLAEAALIEPLAVAVHGIRQLRVDQAERALIFGDGPIGLLMLLLLQNKGISNVVVVGGLPNRLVMAKHLGAAETIDYRRLEAELPPVLRRAYPLIIEATGSAVALRMAISLAPRGGRVLVLGDYDEARADFRWNDLLHREIELIGSNASAGAWTEAVRLACEGRLPLHELITHRVPVDRFAEGIDLTANRKEQCLKVLLDWS